MTREQLRTGQREAATAARRVFLPLELPMGPGAMFRTHEGFPYLRDRLTGSIRRGIPKVRGKAARRADKAARRQRRVT